MRRWIVALAGLGAGMLAGCLLELDGRASCGDGTFDPQFEQCDASEDRSLEGLCGAGETPSCTALTCELGCCGNGEIDPGEACDSSASLTPQCSECVSCQCAQCGNGMLDEGEECDAYLDDIIDMPPDRTMCTDLLAPGEDAEHYEGGGPVTCKDDCTWDRSPCNLCGNDTIDPLGDESCDDTSFRSDRLIAACGASCAHLGERLGCQAECNGCEIEVVTDDPACCVLPGNSRMDMLLPCCCEMLDAPVYCDTVFVPGNISGEQGAGICPG